MAAARYVQEEMSSDDLPVDAGGPSNHLADAVVDAAKPADVVVDTPDHAPDAVVNLPAVDTLVQAPKAVVDEPADVPPVIVDMAAPLSRTRSRPRPRTRSRAAAMSNVAKDVGQSIAVPAAAVQDNVPAVPLALAPTEAPTSPSLARVLATTPASSPTSSKIVAVPVVSSVIPAGEAAANVTRKETGSSTSVAKGKDRKTARTQVKKVRIKRESTVLDMPSAEAGSSTLKKKKTSHDSLKGKGKAFDPFVLMDSDEVEGADNSVSFDVEMDGA